MSKEHFVYCTTNNINGKVYVGKHTGPLVGKYLGSGKYLNKSIAKYGRENFNREILSIHASAEEALQAENNIVTPEFVAREDTYNLKEGGAGGYPSWKGKRHSDVSIRKIIKALKGKKRPAISAAKKGKSNGLEGRKLSSTHKANLSAAKKGNKSTTGLKTLYSMFDGEKIRVHPDNAPPHFVTLSQAKMLNPNFKFKNK